MDFSIPILFEPHQHEYLKKAALDTSQLGASTLRSKLINLFLGRVLSQGGNGVMSWS